MKNFIFKFLNALGRLLRGRGLGLERVTTLRKIYESTYRKVAPATVTLVKVQNNLMYVNPKDEPLGRSLATQGVYEVYETQLFRSLVRPGMTVVDIGANVGYYTLIAAELVGERGKVYAFEPEPGNYGLLVRNVKVNNYANVVTVQKALSTSSGVVKLYVDRSNFGNRSLGKSNIVDDGGAVDAATVSLDEFWTQLPDGPRIDVLKMDAQGAEGLILAGAKKVISQQKPRIFMEFEPEMLRNLGTDPLGLLREFTDFGFDFKMIDYKTKSLRTVLGNQLLEECRENGYVDLFLEDKLSAP